MTMLSRILGIVPPLVLVATLLSLPRVLPGQSISMLHSFTNSPEGATPFAGLAISGNVLFGTTEKGGTNDWGTVFSMTTDGTGFSVLHTFIQSTDGANPYGGLVVSGDTLYGTAASGGTNSIPGGTLFSMDTNGGNFVVLHTFTVADGQFPHGRLILAGDTLYGTTLGAGSTGWGSVFSVKTNGSDFTVLHRFSSPASNGQGLLVNEDGEQPWAGVIVSSNTLYGTAYGGGVNGGGTVYSVKTDGSNFRVLHSFSTNADDGLYPYGELVSQGNTLYGTTHLGGQAPPGALYGNGVVYVIRSDGSGFTLLHSFATNQLDGITPWAGLTVCGNTLYGTARRGGSEGGGTVFSLQTDGSGFAVLHDFTNEPDGAYPGTGLLMVGGTLFGTTQQGGKSGWGTVFDLVMPVRAPLITGLDLDGTNLIFQVQNGLSGHTYTVLASADLTLPPRTWTGIATRLLNSDGPFNITATNAVKMAASQEFYILQTQ